VRRAADVYLKLLRDAPFRSLLASKLANRIANDALLYALLVRVVQETSSARYTTLFVLVFTVPAVAFGLLAGAMAESAPLRPLLLAGHISRVAIAVGILVFGAELWWVFVLLFALATVGQFVGPAEASALPRIVQVDDRSAAHSLVASAAMMGTILGAVTIGPILLAVLGWRAVAAMSAALYCLTAVFSLGVRTGRVKSARPPIRGTAAATLLHGWKALRSSPDASVAFGYLTIAGALTRVLVALAPYYCQDVLGINPENAVYLALPVAVGAVVALGVTPILGKAVGLSATVDIGFFVLLLGQLGVGALLFVSDFVLTNVDLRIGYLEEHLGPSSVITVSLIMFIVIGFGGTMLGIVGASTMNQEVPAASQARVESTSNAVSAAASLVPLFGVAAVADLLGVRAVLVGVGLAALTAALFLRAPRRNRAPVHRLLGAADQ
jgi:MFS family permease